MCMYKDARRMMDDESPLYLPKFDERIKKGAP
jgi:hypothetical protein